MKYEAGKNGTCIPQNKGNCIKKSNPNLEDQKGKEVLRDSICDHYHFSSLWAEKQYLVPTEYIPEQRETQEQHVTTARASTQHGPATPATVGAQQGPAAFMAWESTKHTLCTNVGLLPDKKNKPGCIYDAWTALSAGGIWHALF